MLRLLQQVAAKAERKRLEKLKEAEYDRKILAAAQNQPKQHARPPGRFGGRGGAVSVTNPNFYNTAAQQPQQPQQPQQQQFQPFQQQPMPFQQNVFLPQQGPQPAQGMSGFPQQMQMPSQQPGNFGMHPPPNPQVPRNNHLFGQPPRPVQVPGRGAPAPNFGSGPASNAAGGSPAPPTNNGAPAVPFWKQQQLAQQQEKQRLVDEKEAKLAAIKVHPRSSSHQLPSMTTVITVSHAVALSSFVGRLRTIDFELKS